MQTDPRLIGFTANRSACLFQSLRIRCLRSAVPSIRLKIELILPRATPLQSSFALLLADRLAAAGSPAFGSLSRFATSLERGYVCSLGFPSPASVRPQVFATSRRLLPLSSSRAYFIPLPRPGFFVVQGLLSRCSHPPSSGGAYLLAVVSPPLLLQNGFHRSPQGHVRCSSASRLSSTPGRVPRTRLFTSPEAAPLIEFSCSSRSSHSRRRSLLSQPPSTHDVARRSSSAYPPFGAYVRADLPMPTSVSRAHVRVLQSSHLPSIARRPGERL
jgi:hypothetical protein